MRDSIGGETMFHHESESTWYSEPACRSMGTGFCEATAERDETVVIWRLMTTIDDLELVNSVESERSVRYCLFHLLEVMIKARSCMKASPGVGKIGK
jgi:hypothetical protein